MDAYYNLFIGSSWVYQPPQMGTDKKAMFLRKSTAHFERYVSGIFDNEKKSNK
jgi:hypothetical protein